MFHPVNVGVAAELHDLNRGTADVVDILECVDVEAQPVDKLVLRADNPR